MEFGIDDIKEEVVLFCYVIFSYYGLFEYGSLVCLCIMEVEIIYMIDNLDVSMMMMLIVLVLVDKGEMINKIFVMDNCFFYKLDLD